MAGNEYQRLAKELSRSDFAKRYAHPFLVFGDLEDDWTFEFKTRSVGPPGWNGFLASDDKLKRTTLTELPVDTDDAEGEPLGGIEPVLKSSRNPYSDRISIGRSKTSDVILPSPHVSKLHAHFLPVEGGFELRDAGSANGTFRNGTRLKPDERVVLKPGDRLRFGWMETEFLDAARLYDWLKKRMSTSDFR